MRHCGGGDLAAPAVFADNSNAIIDKVVAHPPCFDNPPRLEIFRQQISAPRSATMRCAIWIPVTHSSSFIGWSALRRTCWHSSSCAGLFKNIIKIAGGICDAQRIVDPPALVGIGHRLFAGLQSGTVARIRSISATQSAPTLIWNWR